LPQNFYLTFIITSWQDPFFMDKFRMLKLTLPAMLINSNRAFDSRLSSSSSCRISFTWQPRHVEE
jgi:hypothetical protein